MGSGSVIATPLEFVNEILLTFWPEILIRASLNVRVIVAGDLCSIAFFLGVAVTNAVCALAIGVANKSRPVVSAISLFIYGKGIAHRDIKNPSGRQSRGVPA